MAALARRLRARLADGPLRRAEIDQLLGKGSAVTNGVGLWLELVRAPPSGTWERRRADLYAAAEEWLGPAEDTHQEATELLVRRYLGGFGPASGRIGDGRAVPSTRRTRGSGPGHRSPWSEPPVRRGAAGPSPRAPPRSRHSRPGSIPSGLGRDPAGPRQANRDPVGTPPAGRLQHQDPAFGQHLPGRRRGRRDLEVRARTRPAGAVRAPHRAGTARAGCGSRAACRAPFVSVRLGSARASDERCRSPRRSLTPTTMSFSPKPGPDDSRRAMSRSGSDPRSACARSCHPRTRPSSWAIHPLGPIDPLHPRQAVSKLVGRPWGEAPESSRASDSGLSRKRVLRVRPRPKQPADLRRGSSRPPRGAGG
jgi:hypothetical protein